MPRFPVTVLVEVGGTATEVDECCVEPDVVVVWVDAGEVEGLSLELVWLF